MLLILRAIRLRGRNREPQTGELRASQCEQRAQVPSNGRFPHWTVVPGIEASRVVARRYPYVFIANCVMPEWKVFQRPVGRIR